MPFSTYETGTATAYPAELYEFRHGPNLYRYTSADEDQEPAPGQKYTATAMERSAIEETQELGRAALRLTAPRTLGVADLFRTNSPAEPVTLTIRRLHRSDAALEQMVTWLGRIIAAEWQELTVTLECESILTAVKRPGLRRRYQLNCPHVLYGADCQASQAAFRRDLTLLSAAGITLTAAAFAEHEDGYYAGGYLEYLRPDGVVERRYIDAHAGQTVTLATAIPALPQNAALSA